MPSPKSKQKGIALFVCLIMLLIMTLVGVSAVQTSTLEVKMASNAHDNLLAFQAAEAGLRAGERRAATAVISQFDNNANGLFSQSDPGDTPIWQTISWTGAPPGEGQRSIDVTSLAAGVTAGVAAQPRYIIEKMGVVLPAEDTLNQDNYGSGTGAGIVQMFRITSLGTGASPNSRVMLQSTFGRRL